MLNNQRFKTILSLLYFCVFIYNVGQNGELITKINAENNIKKRSAI